MREKHDKAHSAATTGMGTESLEDLHRSTLALLNNVGTEIEKIFCIASGGLSFASEAETATEATIFSVIKEMAVSTEETTHRKLRDQINKLATLAGSTLVMEETRNG